MNEDNRKVYKKNVLSADSSLCIGCFSCQTACKLEHDLPEGPRTVKVIRLGPTEHNGGLVMHYLHQTCLHCEEPACVYACPTGAMQKRDDGIVFSDPDMCIGCRTCSVACPYGVPELNTATGKIAKCDGCRERVDRGLWPSCALKCPTGALTYGTADGVVRDRRDRAAARIAQSFSKP
ncbi:MAG: 4Fe-4S dicluster domain-containing protein [Desulfomonilaceae bacterium]|nr:4Fe-4S dicluster domain-containing protein [Desulfomonilaceae bacterium]